MADLTDKTWRKLPAEEWLASGHNACQGCGATIGMRHALKALDRGIPHHAGPCILGGSGKDTGVASARHEAEKRMLGLISLGRL